MKNPVEKIKQAREKFNLPQGKGFQRQLRALLVCLVVAFFLLGQASARDNPPAEGRVAPQTQSRSQFYDVDREVTIEGQIEDLRFENRYEGKGNFLVLLVKEKSSNELLDVETAPAWFFRTDLHKGEKIRLIGSLAEERKDGRKLIIARELRIGNQTITLRDRRGFPTWSRGQGRRKGPSW